MPTKRDIKVELVRRYAREGEILKWGKLLFPEKFTLPFCLELHQYFVDIRGLPHTNTEAPRNHAKTLIKCFLIPLFQALNEPETFQHYLNVQATSTKATAVNLGIRSELENNDLLRAVYGDLVNPAKWTEKQFVIVVRKDGRDHEVVFSAIGAGEAVRGINYKNVRPDYIIVDDLYDEDDINNVESTKKKTKWFWSSLYFARAKSKRCGIHVQGTAINKADLLFELKSKKRWISKTFQAVKDFDAKVVLWPELNSFDDLMEDKTDTGSVIFYRELQNERRDEESSIIKEAWLKFYDGPLPGESDDKGIPEDQQIVAKLCGCDPSIGEKVQNDFTGIANVIKAKLKTEDSYRFYIKGAVNEHLSMDARVRRLDELHKSEKFTKANIEGVAGFKDFVSEVVRRTNMPVTEVDHVKDKITNLENKSHWFENGKVLINRNMDSKMKALIIEQLTNNYPAHDDVRDAILLTISEELDGCGFDAG
jgi:predicted phage terminase large subunit-like protein